MFTLPSMGNNQQIRSNSRGMTGGSFRGGNTSGGIFSGGRIGMTPTTGQGWDEFEGKMPWSGNKQRSLAKEGEANAQKQYEEEQPILQGMEQADKNYGAMMKTHGSGLKSKIDTLNTEATTQGADARANYSNNIQPKLKGIMEDAGKEAGNAMTLQQAGDPNNAIHTAVREMYNKQGQAARSQGQQDFGVLSALGAQAAQGQFGGASPMTAGMQGQIYAQNQSQAGNAYAKSQQRMYDLQQQGIDKGFTESASQYDRGQAAKDRYAGSVRDIDAAETSYLGKQAGIRGERGGYAQDKYGIDTGIADLEHGLAYGQGERKLGSLSNRYGTQNQILANRMSGESAAKQGQMGFLGDLLKTGASAAGARG